MSTFSPGFRAGWRLLRMLSCRRPVLTLVALAIALAAPGCAEEDTEAPAAPRVLVDAAQTAMERTVLHGSAEYGAKLTVTREPAAAEELAPGLAADPYTAAFSVEVPLELGENLFTVVATDVAGNRSQPATLTVTRLARAPRGITLTSSVTLLDADRGSLDLVAQLRHDEPIPLEGMEVLLRAEHEAQAAPAVSATATADAQGRARATLSGLSASGFWKLTATSKEQDALSDTLTVLVRGGAPATLDLALEAKGPGGAPVSGKAITVAPDASIRAVITVKDAPQNVLDVPVTLYTDAPNALIAGTSITGVVKAGTAPYRIVAVASGTSASGEATFQVVPGNLASLELTNARPVASAGEPVNLQVTAADAWGNALGDPQVTFKVAPPLAASFTPPGSSQPLADQGVTGRTFKAYDLSAVESSGYRFTVTAELPSSNATASTELEIRPGRAAGFRLVPDPNSSAVPPPLVPDFFFTSGCATGVARCGTASVAAGQELTYAWGLADAYGNRTAGTVQPSSDAPGSVVLDDALTGTGAITQLKQARAASWTLSARIAGVAQPPLTRAFFVGAAAPAEVAVSASPTVAAAGAPVQAFATVRDAFGNAVACPAGAPDAVLTLTSTPAAASATPLSCSGGTFSRTFTFAASGGYGIEGRWLAGPVLGSTHVTVAGDSTAPTVEIANFTADGVACGSVNPARCTVVPGALIEFDVRATDDSALAELAYGVYFETSQAPRERTVLISGGQKTHSVRFSFTIPTSTRPEQAALVARAADLGGNVAHAPEVILDVSLGAKSTGGRVLTALSTDPQLLNNPSDLVQLASGDLIIGNKGNSTLVRLPAGSRALKPFASLSVAPDRLALDSQGRIYAASQTNGRSVRLASDGTGLTSFTSYAHTGSVALSAPIPQRGFIRGVNTAADGNSATIDSGIFAMTYEIDLNASCTTTSGRTCVPVSAGGSIAAALANAINGNVGSRVIATVENATPATKVGLSAKTAGEATTPLALSATGSLAVTPFSGGHGEEAWVGRTPPVFSTGPQYRFPLEGALPWTGTAHGAYEMGGTQALAIRDVWSANSAGTTDLIIYYSVYGDGRQLVAYRVSANPSGTTVAPYVDSDNQFALGPFNTPAVPFQDLVDVALRGDGRCVLVADNSGPGRGRVYAVNVADANNANVTAELLLDGLERIAGITFDAQGRLLVLDSSARVVYRLAPANPLPTGSCF